MRLIRSWPATIPEDRAYVVDGIEKLVMTGYDYKCLRDVDDDVILIEWDIAVGREHLETFIARALEDPDQIRVAPYRLYPGTYRMRAPIWVHRVRDPGTRRFVNEDDEQCQMFGFGLIYLPRPLVVGFLDYTDGQPHAHFGDSEFSRWHMRHAPGPNKNVPIDWDVTLVHLHYELPEIPAHTRRSMPAPTVRPPRPRRVPAGSRARR